jgi:hypothetical protein
MDTEKLDRCPRERDIYGAESRILHDDLRRNPLCMSPQSRAFDNGRGSHAVEQSFDFSAEVSPLD